MSRDDRPKLLCDSKTGEDMLVKSEDVDLLLSIGVPSKMNMTSAERHCVRKHDMQTKRKASMSQHTPFTTSAMRKKSKGGRARSPFCDISRGILYVPAYSRGVFEHMWKIDPSSVDVSPQTKLTHDKLTDLIKESVVTYAVEPDIGHPWFSQEIDNKPVFLHSITISAEQHFALWNHVCSIRADVTKKQRAINRITIQAGFSQTALADGSGRMKFTFSREKWMKHAPSLMKGGVGSGSSLHKGRPTPIAVYGDPE